MPEPIRCLVCIIYLVFSSIHMCGTVQRAEALHPIPKTATAVAVVGT